jgi:hypothetical protein
LFSNTTGIDNVAVGYEALFSNTTGFSNLAIGSSALFSNNIGTRNLAIGQSALQSNTTGFNNVAMGLFSLFSNTTGFDNLAIGRDALFANTTGTTNIAIGRSTGAGRTTITGCILIGNTANTTADALSNAIAIGDQATVAASNTCVVGRLATAMKLGIGVDPTGDIQTSNTLANNKIVINQTAANQHQFKGFGTEASALRYQVAASTDNHVFYSGINTVSSLALFTITGTGDTVTTGNIYGLSPRALMVTTNGLAATVPSAINTWTKATATTTTNQLNLFDTAATNNRLRYIGTRSIVVQVNLSMSFSPTLVAVAESGISIFKNGVLVTGSDQYVTTSSLTASNLSTSTIVPMVNNDFIEVYIISTLTNSIETYFNTSIITV